MKKLIEVDQEIDELDEGHNSAMRLTRLVYEDDRKLLMAKREGIHRKRDMASVKFVSALVVIFAVAFYLTYT